MKAVHSSTYTPSFIAGAVTALSLLIIGGLFVAAWQGVLHDGGRAFMQAKWGPLPAWSIVLLGTGVAGLIVTLVLFNPAKRVDVNKLPKYVRSKEGRLANAHFQHFLKWKITDPKEREAWQIWSFSQRKFTTEVGIQNTFSPQGLPIPRVNPSEEEGDTSMLFVDEEGYALSSNKKADCLFFEDADILHIESCTRVAVIDDQLIGYYEDGSSIIQQAAPQGCVATCAAMLITDQGKPFTYSSLLNERLSDGHARTLELLTQHGLQAVENPPHGPRSGGATFGVMAHRIIVDDMRSDSVTVRDPYHGWRIKVKREAFDALHFSDAIGVTPTGTRVPDA